MDKKQENSSIPKENIHVQKRNKSNRSFIIIFTIFVIVALAITALAICLTINSSDDENQPIDKVEENVDNEKEIAKDSKFKIFSYNETYNTNAISHISYTDIDGEVIKKSSLYEYVGKEAKIYTINYVQIDGLKNKTIEEKVNKVIKENIYSLKDDSKFSINIQITANFANVLSIIIIKTDSKDYTNTFKCINIDLTTGNEIPFEKVFVLSAPLNSLLADGMYDVLAWDTKLDFSNEAEYNKNHDMNFRDTSDYEDIFLQIVNKYNDMKDKLEFAIYPDKVRIYNLVDDKIVSDEYRRDNVLEIDFVDHKEEIAIYKRYLQSESIFENDNLSDKNIVILTETPRLEELIEIIKYEKTNNLFIEGTIYKGEVGNESYNNIYNYVSNALNKTINELKNTIDKNNGVIYQVEYNLYEGFEGKGYYVTGHDSKATCSLEYYKNNAFKDYITMKNMPKAAVGTLTLADFKDKYTKFNITSENIMYYFDKQGNYIGNDESKAREILGNKTNS